jgi:hypothetical protein
MLQVLCRITMRYALTSNCVSGTANIADCDIANGTVIFPFEQLALRSASNMYTLQLDAETHVEVTGDCKFTAHSCDPNCFVRFTTVDDGEWLLELVAIADIQKDDVLSFDYAIQEHVMSSPFDCACGAQNCVGRAQGYHHLNLDQKRALRPYISPYIASLEAA